MKKILLFILVLFMIVISVACDSEYDDRSGGDSGSSDIDFGDVFGNMNATSKFETLPIDMYMIDYDFDLLCKKSDDYFIEMDSLPIQGDLAPVNVKTTQQIYLSSSRYSSRTEYYIVDDGKVAGYLYTISNSNTMKNYFPSDLCYDIEPKTCISDSGNFTYCCWKTKDSYLILVTPTDLVDIMEYYDCHTSVYILLKDFKQFDFYDQVQ